MATHSCVLQQRRHSLFATDSLIRKLVSLLAAWALIMTTLPAPSAQAARAEWVSSWKFDAVPVADIPSVVHQQGKRPAARAALAPHMSRVSVPSPKKLQPLQPVFEG